MTTRLRVLRPTTLTARLVTTAVALVAVVCLLVAAVTTLAMRSYLNHRLDDEVLRALGRTARPDPDRGHKGPDGHELPNLPDDITSGGFFGQGEDTLIAWIGDGRGLVLTRSGGYQVLSRSALARLGAVPPDGRGHDVEVPAVGDYRVRATTTDAGQRLVVGLPSREVSGLLASLLAWELLLALAGTAGAATIGTVLVRRQLRPLREVAATAHEVATTPLSTGAISLTTRVPDELTDERTEVGRVGAALNTLLTHVGRALDDRHRSEQQVRQFVADASHELRTPLTTIHGYAELSRRNPDDADLLRSSMTKVEGEADRMGGLVDDLLLLARLDAGRPLARDEVDLTRLLLEVVADARVVAPGHVWHLELPDQPVTVTGDDRRLHQVVTNLLNNARRHTPSGTTVTVSLHKSSGATVRVHDDGPGLPSDLVTRAFERFTRGDSSRTRASGGAGLGLSLVQAIVNAHGGSVAVASTPGDTSFTVHLPA